MVEESLKITELPQHTTPVSADKLAIVDSVLGPTKYITYADLTKNIRLIHANAVTPQTATTNTVLHIAQADAAVGRLLVDVYGTSTCAVFEGRAARGTAASPSALQSGDQITEISAHGYGATGYAPSGRGHVRFEADGNWTDTSNPTRLYIDVTPNSSTVPVEAMRITNAGWIGINQNTPVCRVHIVGTHVGGTGITKFQGTTHAFISLDSATGSDTGIIFKENNTSRAQIAVPTGNNFIEFNVTSSYTKAARVDTKGITFVTSIDSGAVADQVSICGYDISAGHRALSLSCEEVVVTEVDETKFSHKLPVRINGVTYNIMLCAT